MPGNDGRRLNQNAHRPPPRPCLGHQNPESSIPPTSHDPSLFQSKRLARKGQLLSQGQDLKVLLVVVQSLFMVEQTGVHQEQYQQGHRANQPDHVQIYPNQRPRGIPIEAQAPCCERSADSTIPPPTLPPASPAIPPIRGSTGASSRSLVASLLVLGGGSLLPHVCHRDARGRQCLRGSLR